jgi:hypothetical protein
LKSDKPKKFREFESHFLLLKQNNKNGIFKALTIFIFSA